MSSQFLSDLISFIHKEQNTQNEQVVEMWQQPVHQRVLAGEAIADIRVVEIGARQAVLETRQNISKFRPNDNLRLSFDAPMSGFAVSCVLEAERANQLVVVPGFRGNFNELKQGNGYTLDRDKVDVRHLLLGAMEMAREQPDMLYRLIGMLQGSEQPQFDRGRLEQAAQLLIGAGFNRSQQEAFQRAYAAHNYYVIQGPPGTGKTRVLSQLARQLASEGERVLVTAFTHRAINNALRTIGQKTMYPHLIKIGPYQNADDLSWGDWQVPNYEYLANSPYRPTTPGIIIGATVYALYTSRLRDMQFDTVIFDEAGQVTLPLALAGMQQARRVILIGDHQQMAPVIAAVHEKDWVKRSVFEAVFQNTPGTMLDITYRMNAAINVFPSRKFYQGKLIPFEAIQDQKLSFTRPPARHAQILDPEKPALFVAINHKDRTMRAPEEAQLAAELIAEAFACGISEEEMAVVAPYRAQGRLIRQCLAELAQETGIPELTRVVVDTVERIQGQERDLVIISLVTSDPAHAAERAEFYFQPNRLNVAITRARKKRIVLGSPLLFETQTENPEMNAWIDIFRDLYHQSMVIKAD